jgi:hypothetical protein
VRAVLRYDGSAEVCGGGGFIDNDDLIFAVWEDAVAPIATWVTPGPGAVVFDEVDLLAVAADGFGVRRVDFFVDGAPAGSAAVAPYTVKWNTTGLPNGDHSLSVRAFDLAGHFTDSAPVTVSVLNTVIPLVSTALYDSVLMAPKCAATAYGCTTGTLVNGRGPVGPEPGQPNTLRGKCADGTAGTYHTDETLDSLTVKTSNGTGLASGKLVDVEASAYVYSFVSDRLDVFYSPDATAVSPAWTYITTVTPTANGLQTLKATFALPVGANLRAIRAVLRYGGVPAACVPGSYNDHDDLVFAADP